MKIILSLFFFLILSIAKADSLVIDIPIYKEYYLKTEINSIIIYNLKGPMTVTAVDPETQRITISQSLAKESLIVMDSKGITNYIVRGQSPDAGSTPRGLDDNRLFKGFFRYSYSTDKNLNSGNQSESANAQWYNQLWLTRDYSFITNFNYRNNYAPNELILDDYFLEFSKDLNTGNQYYLYYGSLSELIDRPYGFLGSNYRGWIYSYNVFDFAKFLVWKAEKKTPELNGGFNGQGKNYGGNISRILNDSAHFVQITHLCQAIN